MAFHSAKPDTSTSAQLKQAALQLFARYGIDGVTVRQIAAAAGQKNSTAIGYHFGSKEGLIRTLLVEGARLIDDRRKTLLDTMDAEGGPTSIREIVDILIYPSVDLDNSGAPEMYNRFFQALAHHHRDLFESALEDRWNSGYQRCLDHLRNLMPEMSIEIKNQRFIFMEAYLGAVLSAREARLEQAAPDQSMWARPDVLTHFADTIVAMLEAPEPTLET